MVLRDNEDTQWLNPSDPERGELSIRSSAKPLITLKIATGKGPRHHHVFFQTDRFQMPTTPLPLDWQMLPWAPLRESLPPSPRVPAPELAGGDWKRGEAVFLSQEANCSACHTLRGKGGKIGPDLSNLVFRDAASVLRDIIDPSAVINPDYVPFTVQLKNGRFLSGIPRADKDGVVRVLDTDAKETIVRQKDIERLDPSSVSIMPKGYAEKLGQEKLRDLLTFLTNPPPDDPPAPAQDGKQAAPPLRRRADVEEILRGTSDAKGQKTGEASELRTLNVVLVAGPKDHGPGEHDYPEWQRRWKHLLGKAAVRLSTAWEWPQQGHWDLADVIVFYFWNHDWNEERYKQLDRFLQRGGGVVVLHSASIADQEPEKLAKRLGLAFQPGRSKYRHGPLDLKFTPKAKPVFEKSDAITAGLSKVSFLDESYWPMIGDVSRVHVLATTEEEGKSWPMIWAFKPSGARKIDDSLTVFGEINVPGRVFGCILGHYSWTFDDPIFRIVFLRGLAWSAGCSFDRFEPLVTDGVKFQEDKP
jgi:putative heme-binding domain-containing protein